MGKGYQNRVKKRFGDNNLKMRWWICAKEIFLDVYEVTAAESKTLGIRKKMLCARNFKKMSTSI